MVLKILAFLGGIFCFCFSTFSAELTLTHENKSEYVIVAPADAIPAEHTAAKELQHFIQEISGVVLPITDSAGTHGQAIYIGQSAHVSTLLGGLDFSTLKPDETLIQTVGGSLILSGGRPRGTLYAVYNFLEDQLGVRFWTANDTYCPTQKNIQIPELAIRYAPSFAVRESTYTDLGVIPFAVRRKINGHWTQVPPEYGGHEELLGWCHTVLLILPPAEYFEKHPEWYSLADGKRVSHGQLCFTNLEMRQEFIKRSKQWLRENPDAHTISISQNDGFGFCECPNCQAVLEREGQQSGVMVEFVNAVAEELEKEFPGIQVETLAYRDTRHVPKTVRPRENVIIRLCNIEADFGSPLSSDANAPFRDDLVAWSKIAKQLYIWNYIANFANYMDPHPNLMNQARDLRFLRNHHAVAVFAQGDNGSNGCGDFVALRTYLISKLMWNPNLEVQDVIHEFLIGYYGPAAGPILENYLWLLQKELNRTPRPRIGTYLYDTNWLRFPSLMKAYELMQEASAAVKGQAPYEERVRMVSESIVFALLVRDELTKDFKQVASYGFTVDSLRQLAQKTIAFAKEKKVIQYQEHVDFEMLAQRIRYTLAMYDQPVLSTLPAFFRQFKSDDLIVVPSSFYLLLSGSGLVFPVEDSAADTGTAIQLQTTVSSWRLIQQVLPSVLTAQYLGRWKIFVELRSELAPGITTAGPVVEAGVVSPSVSPEGNTFITLDGESFTGDHYKAVDCGFYSFKAGDYFYLKPLENTKVRRILVDRLILVREDAISNSSKNMEP